MRKRLTMLIACALVWPSLALAQGRLVCSTPLGWCPAPENAGSASCNCLAEGNVVEGSLVRAERTNPLAELTSSPARSLASLPTRTRASRSFAGPTQLPPADFQAYGVVVFKNRASRFDRDRHLLICEAYVNALAHASEIGAPRERQMVTIWPVRRDEVADELQALPATEACDRAVDEYGLLHAQNALAILEDYEGPDGPYDTSGRGPFLVAWTPGSGIAKPESVALLVDLSEVEHPQEAVEMLGLWRDRIQDNPELWDEGATTSTLIDTIRRFFDRNGQILEAVGAL